jgi:uncharacterized membrane protein
LEDWKIKISVLWLFAAVAFLSYSILQIMEPGTLEQVMAEKVEFLTITPTVILMFAVVMLVPLVMAFLSLILNNPVNRVANIIVGVVYAVQWFGDFVNDVEMSKLSAGRTLVTFSTIVAFALIVWYAWKSKQ